MELIVEYLIPTSKIVEAKHEYAAYRVKRLRKLYYRLFFCLLFNGLYLSLYYLNLDNVHFGNFISVYEMPIIWSFCILVQFAFYYADRLPLLRGWQERMITKYFEKYNKSVENSYLSAIHKSKFYK